MLELEKLNSKKEELNDNKLNYNEDSVERFSGEDDGVGDGGGDDEEDEEDDLLNELSIFRWSNFPYFIGFLMLIALLLYSIHLENRITKLEVPVVLSAPILKTD